MNSWGRCRETVGGAAQAGTFESQMAYDWFAREAKAGTSISSSTTTVPRMPSLIDTALESTPSHSNHSAAPSLPDHHRDDKHDHIHHPLMPSLIDPH